MSPNELSKETPVPFADDQDPARTLNFLQESIPGLLQLIPKDESLERTVKRRDPVEAHRSDKGNASKGVSRTRSARAVR